MNFFKRLFAENNEKQEKQPMPPEYQIKIVVGQFNKKQLLDIQDNYILQANHFDLIGTAFRNLEEYELAEKAYFKAIELKADYEDPYSNLMSLYILQKKYDHCEAIYRKGMDNSSDSKSSIVYQDGRLMFVKGNYEMAFRAAQSVLNVEQLEHEGAFVLAIHALLSLIGEGKETESTISQAVQLWKVGVSKFPKSQPLKELAHFFIR
ncbi:MAG: hypothetical protein LBU83_02455 [Bacteroidales bacterium]|jgi:tetratricopeptide (TPR) repeat protein|nr:hypothetical protein [Bacteroidales bacterium]